MDTTDYIEQEGNNFEEAEKQISRKVFTRRIDVGDAGPRHVGVFARSPATPLINTEHPSILNERVLHRPLLETPHAYPSSLPLGIQALVCASYNAVEQERGREANGGVEGWEGAGVVSRRRYRPLSNPAATLKRNRRNRRVRRL